MEKRKSYSSLSSLSSLEIETDNRKGKEDDDQLRPLTRNYRLAIEARKKIGKMFKFLKRRKVIIGDPFDTLIMKAHYMFAAEVFFMLFIFSTSFWRAKMPINCVDRFDRSVPPDNIIAYCLTYPYTELKIDGELQRVYALHYRWIHISFLLVFLFYKAFTLVQAAVANKPLRKMLKELYKFPPSFDTANDYYRNHRGSQGSMYFKFLIAHVGTLFFNVLSFIVINIILQNQYWNLPQNLLVKRDPATFDDSYSLLFPPFVKCELTPDHHILIERTKRFGCHLTWMEVYEKIFMLLWFFQVFLAVWNIIYLLIKIPRPWCKKWKRRLLIEGFLENHEPFITCADKFSYHSLFELGCVQHSLPDKYYIQLLQQMIEQDDSDESRSVYDKEEFAALSPINYPSDDEDCYPQIRLHKFKNQLAPTAPVESVEGNTDGKERISGSFDYNINRRSLGFDSSLITGNENELNNLQMSGKKNNSGYADKNSLPTSSTSNNKPSNVAQGESWD